MTNNRGHELRIEKINLYCPAYLGYLQRNGEEFVFYARTEISVTQSQIDYVVRIMSRLNRNLVDIETCWGD